LFDPTLFWFVGLLVCYCHLEKSFLLDCMKVLTLPIYYRDNSTQQDKTSLKNQSGITLKKYQAGNNFVQPTSVLVDISPKRIIAGEARNTLKPENASVQEKQETP
jgi:hypothetical protein